MSKNKIIKTLQKMGWLSKHWRVKDFYIYEDDKIIRFSYEHGDMGEVDKVLYYKKDNYVEVYNLDNYYGNTYLYTSLYL